MQLAKIQVQVKPCLAVFRAVSNVEHCDVLMDTRANTLSFVMHCKSGVQKKHRVCVEDSSSNKVCTVCLTAQPPSLTLLLGDVQ